MGDWRGALMSDGITVQVQGAQELERTLHSASRQLLNQTPANQEAGKQLVRIAMGKAPRRTGRLSGSITSMRVDRVQVTVGSNVRYAGFQNYGTSHNRPTYFLTGALDQLTTDAYADYADKVLATVRGA
jgi:HK97 gp10 family phage protein